jgi:hypothetical protein
LLFKFDLYRYLEGALADNEKVANELEKGHKQAVEAVARWGCIR